MENKLIMPTAKRSGRTKTHVRQKTAKKKSANRQPSVYRGSRCGECYWALYDGDWCMNHACVMRGKSVKDNRVLLSNLEAAILINASGGDSVLEDGKAHTPPGKSKV